MPTVFLEGKQLSRVLWIRLGGIDYPWNVDIQDDSDFKLLKDAAIHRRTRVLLMIECDVFSVYEKRKAKP